MGVLAPLDGHLLGSYTMLEFKIDHSFGGWQREFCYIFFPGDLVDFGDALVDGSVGEVGNNPIIRT